MGNLEFYVKTFLDKTSTGNAKEFFVEFEHNISFSGSVSETIQLSRRFPKEEQLKLEIQDDDPISSVFTYFAEDRHQALQTLNWIKLPSYPTNEAEIIIGLTRSYFEESDGKFSYDILSGLPNEFLPIMLRVLYVWCSGKNLDNDFYLKYNRLIS